MLSLNAFKAICLVKDQSSEPFFFVIKLMQATDVTVNEEFYHFLKGQLVFIRPGSEIDFLDANEAAGYIFCFTGSFYERSIEDSTILNSALFFGSESVLVIDDHMHEKQFFVQIVDRVHKASQEEETIFKFTAHHCLETLLLDGYHYLANSTQIQNQKNPADLSLVNNFSILVHKYYREYTSVQFYAEQLHVTPRKLSESCLTITGKSAKTMITEVLVRQALRYIKHTNLSISQISYEMGFNDESNFRNFVKRRTGNIPRAYREN